MKKILLSLIVLLGISTYAMADAFKVETVNVRQGKTGTLALVFEGSADRYYRAYQLDIELPEGLAISSAKIGEAATAEVGQYMISANYREGKYRLIYTDFDGSKLQNGVVAYLTVTDNGEYAVGDVLTATVSEISMTYQPSAEDFTEYTTNFADFNFSINIVEDIVVLDETSTVVPEAANGVNVKVLRTIKADEWSTICLPFAMTEAQVKAAFGDDVELGDFKGYDYDEDADQISVKFDNATAIEANHPYIIKVTNAVSEFRAEGVDIDPEDEPTVAAVKRTKKAWSEMVGTYVAGTVLEEYTLFLNDNKFWYSAGNTTMKAFRAYFDFYDELETKDAANNVKISFNDATGIKSIQTNENASVYSLDGKLMGNDMKKLNRGVYIQNGKKVVK